MSDKYNQRRTYDFNNISVQDFDEEALNSIRGGSPIGVAFPVIFLFFVFPFSIFGGGLLSLFFMFFIINRLTRKSTDLRAKENAYRYYKLLKSRDTFSIDEVAYFINLPVARVQADLQYLFDNNVIIPKHGTIIYDSRKPMQRKYDESKMYNNAQYTIDKVHENYKQDTNLKSYTAPKQKYNITPKAVSPATSVKQNDIHSETMAYIKKIREANDAIPGEAMSAKIDELEKITLNIYNATLENKELLKKTKKFMSYYLPTTEKLIVKYAELDKLNVETENTIAIKKKIEDSLGSITKAFYELYDSLYEYDAIDITSEIEAFKNTLINDGLLDSGLKIGAKSECEE